MQTGYPATDAQGIDAGGGAVKRGPKSKHDLKAIDRLVERVLKGELTRKEAAFESGYSITYISLLMNGYRPKSAP